MLGSILNNSLQAGVIDELDARCLMSFIVRAWYPHFYSFRTLNSCLVVVWVDTFGDPGENEIPQDVTKHPLHSCTACFRGIGVFGEPHEELHAFILMCPAVYCESQER